MKTFKTEIRNVFEKGLKPYGFVKAKCTNPYYVRLINEEILHVITYRENTPLLPNYKSFFVLFGVATVYKKELPLERTIRETPDWLTILSVLPLSEVEFESFKNIIPYEFTFIALDEMAMSQTINNAFSLTEQCAIPVLSKINSLEACIEHFYKYKPGLMQYKVLENGISGPHFINYGEELLPIKVYGQQRIDDYVHVLDAYYKELSESELERIKNGMCGLTLEEHERENVRLQENKKRKIRDFTLLVTDDEWNEKIYEELSDRKVRNIEILKKCGILK